MRALTVDLSDPNGRPYFFWDEDVSVAELRAALQSGADEQVRMRLMGKLLRDARDVDVWRFVTPSDVADKRASGAMIEDLLQFCAGAVVVGHFLSLDLAVLGR